MSEDYKKYKDELKKEQAELTREEIAEMMGKRSEFTFDPDTAKPVEHRWISRGLVMSCENAGHPHHQSFKRV